MEYIFFQQKSQYVFWSKDIPNFECIFFLCVNLSMLLKLLWAEESILGWSHFFFICKIGTYHLPH